MMKQLAHPGHLLGPLEGLRLVDNKEHFLGLFVPQQLAQGRGEKKMLDFLRHPAYRNGLSSDKHLFPKYLSAGAAAFLLDIPRS